MEFVSPFPVATDPATPDSVASEAVYLDNNATAPLDPRVAATMRPWLEEHHGNPSSLHQFGQRAREAVETARSQVARLIGASPLATVFCASGTEANNAVLWTIGSQCRLKGHLVLSSLEHPSVEKAAQRLEELGMEVTRIAPNPDGFVPSQAVVEALRPDTRLVALMLANNELGTLQPVAEVGAACREREIPVLCDAVQAAGKIPVDVEALHVDYLTVGGHKFHGPLGAAALWVRKGAPFDGYQVGGSQERRRRAGTENVPALVGFGHAAELARQELPQRNAHLQSLRNAFEAGLSQIPEAIVHCATSARLPHTSHVAFLGVEAESLTIRLDLAGFAVSTGSACSSGVVEPSPTLTAMGLSPSEALASIRVSFGIGNRIDQVHRFLTTLATEVATLRKATSYRTALG